MLAPCPFCGGLDWHYGKWVENKKDFYAVVCNLCGAQGPRSYNYQDKAMESWDKSYYSVGCSLIRDERKRQIDDEMYSEDHDTLHQYGELLDAAICYCLTEYNDYGLFERPIHVEKLINVIWPWGQEYWKPKDKLRNLIRAGALIAAELDRLNRIERQKYSEVLHNKSLNDRLENPPLSKPLEVVESE